jgi:hypothetical protein
MPRERRPGHRNAHHPYDHPENAVNHAGVAHWASTHQTVLVLFALLFGVLAFAVRRIRAALSGVPAAVLVAAVGAVLCTAYSAGTSWAFARDHLGMPSIVERGVMFAAGEVALFSMALMARQNLRTTEAPGAPGVLVWVITGVQVIPAFMESGIIAGTVRAFAGPILAALLWHLAMGIELRHVHPGADSQSLPAILAREARERLLARLGLSRRERDAVQIRRERWTGIATRRAAHLADLQAAGAKPFRLARARHRLAIAVDRTDAGLLSEQQEALLLRLSAYRNAGELATLSLLSPWRTAALVEPEATNTAVPFRVPERRRRQPRLRQRRGPISVRGDYRALLRVEQRPTALESHRQVDAGPLVVTPADLRRKVAKLNREAVTRTGRPVTIGTIRNDLGVSRRDAASLRREVVSAGRS